MKKKYVVIWLLLIIIVSSFFVLKNSYFLGHDLDFHLSRIISLKECISIKKMCYVAPNYLNNYGYGTPLFYPEFFLLLPAFLLYLGLSLTTTYKIFIFIINSLSILSMYFCVKKITNNYERGLFSSFLYAFTSYRILDLTARGALGESLSFIFFPIVILGIYEIIYGNYKNYRYLIIGMSGIILSHLLSSIIICIYLMIVCLINFRHLIKDKKRIKYLVISALFTFLLTSYFTVPMMEQLFNTTYKLSMDTTILKLRAMPFYYLFLEAPFTQLIGGDNWQWSPGTIGTIYVVLLFLLLVSIFKKKKYSKIFVQNLLISIIFIILTTRIFPWQYFQHIFHVIQFPWRLYIIPSIILPMLGYSVIDNYNDDKKFILIILSILSIFSLQVITSYKNITYVDKNAYHGYDIMWEDYLPISLSSNYINDRDDIISSNNEFNYTYKRKNNSLIISFDNNILDTNLELPFVYYKGYSAYIDDKSIPLFESMNGLVGITIDKEYRSGIIKVFYEGTLLQEITRYVSIIALFMYIIFYKKMKIK